MTLSVGDKFDAVQHYPEGIIFDADPDGLRLYINFNNPTIDEINTLAIDEPGEIRFVCVKGILFFLIKLDWMEWGDAPYAVQLSEHPFPTLEHGEGYKMSFILINRATSRIAALRQINLGVEFSRTLQKEVMAQANNVIIAPEYYKRVAEVQKTYTTKDLLKMSVCRYRFGRR